MGGPDVHPDIEEQSRGTSCETPSSTKGIDHDLDTIEQTRPSVFVWLVASAAAIGRSQSHLDMVRGSQVIDMMESRRSAIRIRHVRIAP